MRPEPRSFFAGVAVALALAALVAAAVPHTVSADADAPVAFSARGDWQFSSGPPKVVKYAGTITNEGDHWNGLDEFTAPVDGLYFFSIHFVKDTYYESDGVSGTTGDVYVRLRVSPVSAAPPVPLAAWAGKDAGGDRATGALSTVLRLPAGAVVKTKAWTPGGALRHARRVYFSGFLIQ